MEPETHERRRRIWELLVQEDHSVPELIETVAEEFNTAPDTVEEEVETIDDWLHELDLLRRVSGISLLAELQQNRQQLHQMARQARDEEDLVQERKIRAEINRSLNIERQLNEDSTKIRHIERDFNDLMDDLSGY